MTPTGGLPLAVAPGTLEDGNTDGDPGLPDGMTPVGDVVPASPGKIVVVAPPTVPLPISFGGDGIGVPNSHEPYPP
jgi:hypothetical protein